MGEVKMESGLFVCHKNDRKTLGVVEKVVDSMVFVRWLEPPASVQKNWEKYFFDEDMRNEPIGYPSAAIEIRAI
jgi:hypothetical protein